MFDSMYYGGGNSRVSVDSRVNVTEKRAPTDESVRLLREMEQAAKDRVVETTIVRDTDFECVIYKMADAMSGDTIYSIVYSLGGKKHTTQYRSRSYDQEVLEDLTIGIRDAVARDISNAMLQSAFSKVQRW